MDTNEINQYNLIFTYLPSLLLAQQKQLCMGFLVSPVHELHCVPHKFLC